MYYKRGNNGDHDPYHPGNDTHRIFNAVNLQGVLSEYLVYLIVTPLARVLLGFHVGIVTVAPQLQFVDPAFFGHFRPIYG